MALGDRTFQLLQKAQKNSNNKLKENKKIFNCQEKKTINANKITENHNNKNDNNLQFNQKDNIDDNHVIVDDN